MFSIQIQNKFGFSRPNPWWSVVVDIRKPWKWLRLTTTSCCTLVFFCFSRLRYWLKALGCVVERLSDATIITSWWEQSESNAFVHVTDYLISKKHTHCLKNSIGKMTTSQMNWYDQNIMCVQFVCSNNKIEDATMNPWDVSPPKATTREIQQAPYEETEWTANGEWWFVGNF